MGRRSKHGKSEKSGSKISNTAATPKKPLYVDPNYRIHHLEWLVAAPMAGRLVKTLVKDGTMVKKGQPMFVMVPNHTQFSFTSEDRQLEVVACMDGEAVFLDVKDGVILTEGQSVFFLVEPKNVIPPASPRILDLVSALDDSRDVSLKDALVDFNAAAAGYKPLATLDDQDVHKRYKSFKKFDTVFDHLDHLFSGTIQPSPTNDWAESIKKERISLQEGLPDTIFVRAYESRMDLLRAVIIGLEGTPYHNGLFIFDVCLPEGYPHTPPLVRYRSGGIVINPNLRRKEVYLKLPSTTTDRKEEDMWVPGTSTMLQLLVSIQNQILCANPFLCDVAAAKSTFRCRPQFALIYRENTFIKSLKTMEYIINNPPKNFEDFVVGHFCNHATDILMACKEEASKESCTTNLKRYLELCFNSLVVAFSKIGAKEPQDFLPLVEKLSLFA